MQNWLTGKDPDTQKDGRQEEKGTIEDEIVGWHPQLDGHEFEQAPGDGDGQGRLVCCSPCGCKESDTDHGVAKSQTELNWTELNWTDLIVPGDWEDSKAKETKQIIKDFLLNMLGH